MAEQGTVKPSIRIVVDGDGTYAVGAHQHTFDELAADAGLTLPIATYDFEIEVPRPSPVKATTRVEAAGVGPVRLSLK